jgi:hypothetical protein
MHILTAVLVYDSALTVTSAPISVNIDVILPGSNDLLQQTESFDFDSTPDGTLISPWLDKTPYHNNWVHYVTDPVVDGTITAGGHKTLRFSGTGTCGLKSINKFIPNGLTGMELMVIFRAAVDPPPTRNAVITYQTTPNEAGGTVATHADQGANPAVAGCGGAGPFYLETFCVDNTLGAVANCGPFLNLGTPATNTASEFVCYNLSAESGGPFDAFINSEHFFTSPTGFPFISQGTEIFYTVGWGLNSNGSADYFAGNIAAVYLWKRALTSDERDKARIYIAQKWGVPF